MTLAILPNWLGDLVMVEPAVRAMRRHGPVTGVVSPALAPLVEDGNLVDRIELFDRRGKDSGLGGLIRAGRRLRGHESATVFGPSLRAAALAVASGAPVRRGLGGAGRELFLTDVGRPSVPPRSGHQVDDWIRLVDPQAMTPAQCQWETGARGREGLERICDDEPGLREPFVVFAASAMYGPAKEWPGESFVEVARTLRSSSGLRAVFVGGPAPSERERAAQLAARCDGLDLAGRTDLPTLAALLAQAELFVGNDSGPMHLAAATGTPTVGIFGSTSPVWTAPRGKCSAVAGPAPVDCTPCFRRTCPFDHECLTGTTPSAVLGLVEQLREPS